jgi:hypothetical protein
MLIDLGDGKWIGADRDAGIWIGGPAGALAMADLGKPLFLLPALEKPLAEVLGGLRLYWAEFELTGESPHGVARKIAEYAVRRESDHWVSHGLAWLEELLTDHPDEVLHVTDALAGVSRRDLSQSTRRRAMKLLNQVEAMAGGTPG